MKTKKAIPNRARQTVLLDKARIGRQSPCWHEEVENDLHLILKEKRLFQDTQLLKSIHFRVSIIYCMFIASHNNTSRDKQFEKRLVERGP